MNWGATLVKRGYPRGQAHRKALERPKSKPRRVGMTPEVAASVETLLAEGWSPE